jgi:Holliday junction resolvase RusA-like endonuclease
MITILGQVPSKSNGYKIGNNRLYKSKELKEYEASFKKQILNQVTIIVDIEFKIDILVYFQSNRSDLDNAAKIILDCLQTCGIVKNDRLCHELHMTKFIDKENPRIEFRLY